MGGWLKKPTSAAIAAWDSQVLAINKVQRLPERVETNFYRMHKGRPCFPPELAFPNKTGELAHSEFNG